MTKKLYIPVKIKKNKEVLDIPGVEKLQIIQTLFGTFIGFVLGGIVSLLLKHVLWVIFITIFISCTTFMLVRKDSTNRSTIDKFNKFMKFKKEQKIYKYKYFDIYKKEN